MHNASLSHSRAITVLNDPIHDSISVTCFEREIIDSEYFQRLHFVLQNSTTYVAFPSNKNSRFSHSLGVAHLCGKLFTYSLRNSSPQDLKPFLETAAILVNEVALKATVGGGDKLRGAWKSTISGNSEFRHRPSLMVENTGLPVDSLSLDTKYPEKDRNGRKVAARRKFTAGMLVDTLWQAIRICGLVHDIGHLPMSHSLEGAAEKLKARLKYIIPDLSNDIGHDTLEDIYSQVTCSEKYQSVIDEYDKVLTIAYPNDPNLSKIRNSFASFPLHEKRSLYILDLLFRNGIFKYDEEQQKYRELIYNIAFLILFSSIESEQNFGLDKSAENGVTVNNSAFRFLKLIVAGAIDGDRMDYTIRDGHACGSSIGKFDISGITEHATLFREKNSNELKIGYFHRALPAIEQFFSQRHQGYKYLIYHRTSSRTEACLQHLVLELIELCYLDSQDDIATYFEALGYFSHSSDYRHSVFPIYLESEVEDNKTGETLSEMPHLDDSNLRSFFEWTLLQISVRKDKESGRKLEKFKRIETLLKIVLKRQFQHIYDPFKSKSLKGLAETAFNNEAVKIGIAEKNIQKLLLKGQGLFARNKEQRNEILKSIRSTITEAIPEEVQMLVNVQEPKVYDHDLSSRKGEEIYIIYNGVDKGGYVPVRPINRVSTSLNLMRKIFVSEFKVCFYFVSGNIKFINREDKGNLLTNIDLILEAAFENAAGKFIKNLIENEPIEQA